MLEGRNMLRHGLTVVMYKENDSSVLLSKGDEICHVAWPGYSATPGAL